MVNQNAYAPTESAGTRHYELAHRLIDRGHEVLVVATSFYHKSRRETRIHDRRQYLREVVQGVPFHWVKTPPYTGNGVRRAVNQAVFMAQVWRGVGLGNEPRPDVILGSSPPLLGAFGAERLARRLNVPFISEIRDIWPETLVDLGGVSRTHPFILASEWLERHLYNRSDHVLTVLPLAESYILEKGERVGGVTWIPNGAAVTGLETENGIRPAKRPFTFMYAGAHGLYNGLDIVLEAVASLQARGKADFRLIFLGDGPYKKALIARRDELNLTHVSFEDPIPKSSVHGRLKDADAFIMIIRNAGVLRWGVSPNKLFDYMASARPILFAVKTPSDPIRESQSGISVEPSIEGVAAGMEQLLACATEDLAAMGRQARAYVETHHDFDHLAARLEAVLGEVVYMRQKEATVSTGEV